MSVLKAPIDYKRLEEELYAALAADKLYKLQNDAKIRAIEQAVPTYEHFRQMVTVILVICHHIRNFEYTWSYFDCVQNLVRELFNIVVKLI